MNAWKFLIELNDLCCFQTREGKLAGKASNSEIKRWLQNGSVLVNGKRVRFDEELTFPIESLVLFPKGRRITLY